MASVVHEITVVKVPKQTTANIEVISNSSKVVEVGMKGIQGSDGKSAYEVAVKNGFKGTESEWLSTLKGDAFEYSDFTAEQLYNLRGPKGAKGDPFTYEDFTPEQLDELVAKQPPLDPSPVELFNIAFEG